MFNKECECVDDGDDCPIPNPSCPLHGEAKENEDV
jgi:hypothetical protein